MKEILIVLRYGCSDKQLRQSMKVAKLVRERWGRCGVCFGKKEAEKHLQKESSIV